MYLLQTLGAVALHPDSGRDLDAEPLLRGSKTLVLAAYLAERPDRSAPREHLAELFWPAVPSTQARRSLRQALYYLTQSGGEGVLEADGEVVRLDRGCCTLDAQLFEQALREERFEAAAELYSGPFLQGFDPGKSRELATWIDSVRERLEVGYRQALRESARTALVRSDAEQAVAFARRACDAFPLDDSVHALLLEALAAAGRPAEAVREYEAYRVLLREELDDVPSGDITEIAERARQLARERASMAAGVDEDEDEDGAAEEPGLPDRRAAHPEQPPRGARTWFQALLLVAGIAGVTLAVLIFLNSILRRNGEDSVSTPVPTAVRIQLRGNQRIDDGMRPITLEFESADVTEAMLVPGSEGELGQLIIQSPDGRYEAVRVQTPNGPDLEIRDARTGELVAPIPNRDGRTPDDHIHGWSPDSRVLLFSSGLFDANGNYDQRLYLFDVESATSRPVTRARVGNVRTASWSPLGNRIAVESFREGAGISDIRTDVSLVSVDGREIARLTDDDAADSNISWSPDGTRLAYLKGDDTANQLFVLDAESREAWPITEDEWPKRYPVWLSDDRVIFAIRLEDRFEVRIASVDRSSETVRVTGATGIESFWQRIGPLGSVPWIESVKASVSAPDGTFSPGEHARLDVRILDSEGTLVHPESYGFEWRVLDPERASILEGPLLAVTDTGTIRIVADVGGWRADTLVLESRRLAVRDPVLLFEERWTEGLSSETWQTHGTPEPAVRPDGGPGGGGVFHNRGDENHGSGAFTTVRFPTDDGISVEAWGRVPLSGGHFQTWEMEFARDAGRNPDTGELSLADRAAWIQLISGTSQPPVTTFLASATLVQPMPEPERIGEWRLHVLQLHPDGTVEWIVDGRRHASLRSSEPAPDSVQLVLSGRMIDTVIEHGPLRVWGGLRYESVRR